MNVTKQLKKSPLPVGFYSICGEQGAGKTSCAVGLLRTDYKRWGKIRYEWACEKAREYYELNGIRLNIDKILYFSSTEIILDERRGIKTHEIDLSRLGLPNPETQVQYLPYGSVVFIMEADILAYCHNWQSLPDYLRNLIKYVRHFKLTIIFDMQVGGALAKALRELVMGTYYMISSGVKRFLFFWKRQKWNFIYIRNQLVNVVKEFAEIGIKLKVPVWQNGKFRVWGQVFSFYNSFSGEPYFLNGIESVGYEYRKHHEGDLSIAGIKAYCEAHPLERDKDEEDGKQSPAVKKPTTKKEAEAILKLLLK